MADDFYGEMQGVARDVLTEFNQGKIEYVALTPGTGPAQNPGEPTEQAYTIPGAVRGVKFKYIDNSTIVQSDQQATMAVSADVTPNMAGFMRVDGVRYKIIAIKPIPPAGTPVANVIIFRK